VLAGPFQLAQLERDRRPAVRRAGRGRAGQRAGRAGRRLRHDQPRLLPRHQPHHRGTAAYERDPVGQYHRALVAHGVDDYDAEQCRTDQRVSAIHPPRPACSGWARPARGPPGADLDRPGGRAHPRPRQLHRARRPLSAAPHPDRDGTTAEIVGATFDYDLDADFFHRRFAARFCDDAGRTSEVRIVTPRAEIQYPIDPSLTLVDIVGSPRSTA
jgi:hypothetical protein